MKTEKQQQAKQLYFQTGLTKTQIAGLLNISRRSLHYWIQQNEWDRLKLSATHLPAMLAENCYVLIAQYQKHLISSNRIMRPITKVEADTLHKLALTVKKLKNHSTLNEGMELFAHFMERVSKKNPELAAQLTPFVDEHIEDWANISFSQFKPTNMEDSGYLSIPPEDPWANEDAHAEVLKESKLDDEDFFAWDNVENLHRQLQYFQQQKPTSEEDRQQKEDIIRYLESLMRDLPKDESVTIPVPFPPESPAGPVIEPVPIISGSPAESAARRGGSPAGPADEVQPEEPIKHTSNETNGQAKKESDTRKSFEQNGHNTRPAVSMPNRLEYFRGLEITPEEKARRKQIMDEAMKTCGLDKKAK